MILVPLRGKATGRSAMIDECDADLILPHLWYQDRMGYAFTNLYTDSSHDRCRRVPMHRMILGASRGQVVDHRDHNPLNNTRSNIRIATLRENSRNRRGVTGVRWNRRRRKWEAHIWTGAKRVSLGFFRDRDDAVEARKRGEVEHFGAFALCLSGN